MNKYAHKSKVCQDFLCVLIFFYCEVKALYDNKVKSVVEQPLLNNLSGFWEMQFKCLPPRKKAEFTFSI